MKKLFSIFLFVVSASVFSQIEKKDTIQVEHHPTDTISIKPQSEVQVLAEIEEDNAPLVKPKYSPTKAGLYSAVLPGLGQYYNRKYWKIPIVWGGIGTGVGVTLWNDKQYKRYRDAYVAELNGLPHEFSDIPGITKEALGRTQDRVKRQRDYSIAVTGLVYILNIMDAVVDAHLYEQRNDPDLAIKPTVIYDEYGKQMAKAGLSFNYKF